MLINIEILELILSFYKLLRCFTHFESFKENLRGFEGILIILSVLRVLQSF